MKYLDAWDSFTVTRITEKGGTTVRKTRTDKEAEAQVKPDPTTSILDTATIKYAAPCSYCLHKQKVITTTLHPRRYRTTSISICGPCLVTASMYLLKFRKAE